MGDGYGNCFTFGRSNYNLISNIYSVVIAEDARDHQLGSIADGIDRGILDHNSFHFAEHDLKR